MEVCDGKKKNTHSDTPPFVFLRDPSKRLRYDKSLYVSVFLQLALSAVRMGCSPLIFPGLSKPCINA